MKLRFAAVLLSLLAHSVAAQAPSNKPSGCTVRGEVLQEPGDKPIRKADVQLSPLSQDESTVYSAATDAEGKFIISDIPPGRYRLSAERIGLLLIDKKSRTIQGQTLSLKSAEEATNLVLRMQPAGAITGKVLDRDRDPIPWASVMATRYPGRSGERARSAEANDQGEYRIALLPPGRYLVAALSTGDASDEMVRAEPKGEAKDKTTEIRSYTTYCPGTADRNQAALVEIHAGDEIPLAINMVFGPDDKDQPVAGATVVVIPDAPRRKRLDRYQSDTTDEQGRFKLHGLATGEYNVIAVEGLEQDYRDLEFLAEYASSGLPVRLEKGEHKAISLKALNESAD
jgi:hypothetical protein